MSSSLSWRLVRPRVLSLPSKEVLYSHAMCSVQKDLSWEIQIKGSALLREQTILAATCCSQGGGECPICLKVPSPVQGADSLIEEGRSEESLMIISIKKLSYSNPSLYGLAWDLQWESMLLSLLKVMSLLVTIWQQYIVYPRLKASLLLS